MKITRRRFLASAAGAGLGVAAAYGFLVEPGDVEYTFHDIGPRPGRSRPIRFAQLSDLHISGVGRMHRGIAEKLRGLDLDLLFITGDAIDSRSSLPDLDEFLALLPKELPKYAIPGNWEYWGHVGMEALAALYSRHNARLLVNASDVITVRGESLLIAGVDDLVGGMPGIEQTLGNMEPQEHCLLLAHCPAYRDFLAGYDSYSSMVTGKIAAPIDLAAYSINCVLSGHTHGGQVNVLGLHPSLPQGSGKYFQGWYRGGGPDMYVSRGIGTSILPLRIGARPEIPVFSL